MSMAEKSSVRIDFIGRSNGAATEVKVEVAEGATKEMLEDMANMAYEVAIASYKQADAYATIHFRK